MKRIFIVSLVSSVVLLTSCLKGTKDFGGTRTDDGSIVTEIPDVFYNESNGYDQHVSIPFAGTTETVQFFTVKVNAAREKKLSGPLTLNLRMTSVAGYTNPGAAVTVPATITIPSFEGDNVVVPVSFTVNKASLSASGSYAATFKISSPTQGIVTPGKDSITVYFDNSKYAGRYNIVTNIVDASNAIGKLTYPKTGLFIPYTSTILDTYDTWYGNYYYVAKNLATGGATALFYPEYEFSPTTDKVIGVYNATTGAPYTATLSTTNNQFTYTNNVTKSFKLTYVLSGRYTITEDYQFLGQAY